jgi:uncharacterized cupin superfamily protein
MTEPPSSRNADGIFERFHETQVPWTDFVKGTRFATRYRALGRFGGAGHAGTILEELLPGKQSRLQHYHLLEEEHVHKLDGTATLLLGDKRHQLVAGSYACFPAGQKQAHCLVNETDRVCRYLVIGESNPHDICIYPNAGRICVRLTGQGYRQVATMDYWEDEEEADPSPPSAASPPPAATDAASSRNADGIFEPFHETQVPWTEFTKGTRFAMRFREVGRFGGGSHVGVAVEELLPGKQSNLLHYHMLEEEHVYLLAGEATLLLGDRRYPLVAGSYASFPAGQTQGHCLINHTDQICRYLVFGEDNPHDVAVFPKSGRVSVRLMGEAYRKSAVMAYWEGEEPA